MPLGLIAFTAWMAFMAIICIAFFVWGWKENQFHNIEEAKYRMLEDREPQPWPGREQKQGKKDATSSEEEGRDHDGERT